MLDLRCSAAAALLVGAAIVPTLATGSASASAVGSSSAAVPAVAAVWVLIGTYPDLASCEAAASTFYPGQAHQCLPSPGGYDLYVWM